MVTAAALALLVISERLLIVDGMAVAPVVVVMVPVPEVLPKIRVPVVIELRLLTPATVPNVTVPFAVEPALAPFNTKLVAAVPTPSNCIVPTPAPVEMVIALVKLKEFASIRRVGAAALNARPLTNETAGEVESLDISVRLEMLAGVVSVLVEVLICPVSAVLPRIRVPVVIEPSLLTLLPMPNVIVPATEAPLPLVKT